MNSPPGVFNLRSSFSQRCHMLFGAQYLSPAIAGMVDVLTLPILNCVTARSHKINLMSTPVITKTKIAERLIESILTAKLRPGEKLGEQDIADLFQVSRTLVREALMHLQTRGFVEVRSRVGWYVAEPSFEEAQETYAARRVVEPACCVTLVNPCRQH